MTQQYRLHDPSNIPFNGIPASRLTLQQKEERIQWMSTEANRLIDALKGSDTPAKPAKQGQMLDEPDLDGTKAMTAALKKRMAQRDAQEHVDE